MRHSICPAIFIILGTVFLFPLTLQADQAWTKVSDKNEITVWSQNVPGTSLVAFKGQGIANASILDIFAVLYDSEHKLDLLTQSAEYRLIEIHSKTEFTIYNHVKSPFLLISDRDVVLKTDMVFDPENHTLIAPFWNVTHSQVPPREGIERMKKCKGSWTLQYLGPSKTLLTYEVQADPGGWLPGWVVNIANKRLPHRTIENMRRQVQKKELYKKSHSIIREYFDFYRLLGLNPPPKAVLSKPQTSIKNAE